MKKTNFLLALGMGIALAAFLSRQPRRPRGRNPLAGRPATALITGASSGIGEAFARQLAAQRFDLILVARREERLRALAAELERQYGITAQVWAADLASSEGIERVESSIAALPDLRLLINNAGFGSPGMFAEADLERLLDMIQVHVDASVRLTRAALPGMIAKARGGIINVSSLITLAPLPGGAMYAATKTFLNVFTKTLQIELAGTGVQVQLLCPGFTVSGFHDAPDGGGTFSRSQIPEFLWMTSDAVAAESLSALALGQTVCIPGRINRIAAAVARPELVERVLPLIANRIAGH